MDDEMFRALTLARASRTAAERMVAALPVERCAELAASAPAERAREFLLLCPDARPVVRALSAPAAARLLAGADDEDAIWLLECLDAPQLAIAIDLHCRRRGVLRPGSFRRFLERLVGCAPERVAEAVAGLDPQLLAAGLRGFVHVPRAVAELLAQARYAGREIDPQVAELLWEEGEIGAFLRLLDEAVPELLAEVIRLIAEDDAIDAEDDAGYERRMRDAGLPDWTAAASQLPATASADSSATRLPAASDAAFLRVALARLAEEGEQARIEAIARGLADLATRLAIVAGPPSDDRLAAARVQAEALAAQALRRQSHGDLACAVEMLRADGPEAIWARAAMRREVSSQAKPRPRSSDPR